MNKIAIPQADEQQRLLANLITIMERDRKPLPRFWYLPRGEKAAVVMTGDDHRRRRRRHGRTLRPLQGAEPARLLGRELGVRPRHLVRLPEQPAHERAGGAYVARASRSRCTRTSTEAARRADRRRPSWTRSSTPSSRRSRAKYPSVPAPVTERTHCVAWSDWASAAKVEAGVRHPPRHQLLPLPGRLDRQRSPAS